MNMTSIPIIDISNYLKTSDPSDSAITDIASACLNHGFFYISEHGISRQLQENLFHLATHFFNLPAEIKTEIEMAKAGRAWRGFFPVGTELTSGKPDQKEGLYFGIEHPDDHPRVLDRTIMHGRNQFPNALQDFKSVVIEYMESMTQLGQTLMELIALSLELPKDYFSNNLTRDPWTLFRIFHYPSQDHSSDEESWGVGEHTDYGMLTILKQDAVGGLQIKSKDSWMDAPYIENTFVCNIGDMLSKMTRGYYRATPHRVKNRSDRSRYSFPFFFDPGWETYVEPIDLPKRIQILPVKKHERWDHEKLELFQNSYGSYISNKVAKVFPDLI